MTQLYQRHLIRCPYALAKNYLAAAVERQADSGALSDLTLRVPVGPNGSQTIEKDVVVNYARGTDAMRLDQRWVIHWTPKNGGPYPDFVGQLSVRADYDYDTAILELEGEYQPPLGLAGRVFDFIAGTQIASATARELLREIGLRMERRYGEQEAQKAVLRSREREESA